MQNTIEKIQRKFFIEDEDNKQELYSVIIVVFMNLHHGPVITFLIKSKKVSLT